MTQTQNEVSFQTIDLNFMRPAGFLEEMTRVIQKKHELVDAKHGWKDVKQCPVCQHNQTKLEFIKFEVPIVRCEGCSLRFASRIPVKTADIYSDASYLPLSQQRYLENVAYRKERFGRERLQLIENQIGTLKGKKLLDIGCGTGWFLDLAKEAGMIVSGQEIGEEIAAWTARRLGISVFTEPLEEIRQDLTFDVITLFDLLEHVEDPMGLVLACQRRLNANGILLVFTPHFESLALNLMREESNLVCPTDHLTYFTKKAVLELVSLTDLTMVYYATCGIDFGDMKSFYEFKKQPHLADACALLYDQLQPVIDRAGLGNHMRFILKKGKDSDFRDF